MGTGLDAVQVTGKVKRQTIGRFMHAERAVFGDSMPAAPLQNIISKMLQDDGSMTPGLIHAANVAFSRLSPGNETMDMAALENYFSLVNQTAEGVAHYRSRIEEFHGGGFSREDFLARYHRWAKDYPWLLEYELRTINGEGMERPSDGPCELRFDHMYFSPALRLIGVQEPLSEERRRSVWGEPWDVVPNEWHPSDHL